MDTPCKRCAEKGLQCRYIAVADQRRAWPSSTTRAQRTEDPLVPPEAPTLRPGIPSQWSLSPVEDNYTQASTSSPVQESGTHSKFGFNPLNVMPTGSQSFIPTEHETTGRSARAQYPEQAASGYAQTAADIQPPSDHAAGTAFVPPAPLRLPQQQTTPRSYDAGFQYFPDVDNVLYLPEVYTG